ncbi:hypothetical protein PENANT_c013G00806 [Penicillium antarcticum]|uniref:ASST-domain-containing protein n=1 Tax=Penicillium antarcticum TaxID=416450 RepID=A0A1V6Q4P5_9EURO|nr:hypothetical protein PENANT_c013G00806 [Penicillium antarcticum]
MADDQTVGSFIIDIKSKEVLFTWDATDQIDIKDSNMEMGWSITGDGRTFETDWDYFHLDSIDKMQDGSYLTSGRHTSTIYKMSPKDGSILWRLGGNKSDFTLKPGLNLSSQHHVRVRGEDENGMTISLLNNANDEHHQTALSSSGLVLRIGMDTMHVTLVHRYYSPQGLLADREDSLTEHILDDSHMVFETKLEDPTGYWYRNWKVNLTTAPATSPVVYALSEVTGGPTVWYVSWNGAIQVHLWRIYASQEQWDGYQFVGNFEKVGFETRIESEEYFAWTIIEAVDGAGRALRNSSVSVTTFTRDLDLIEQQNIL